MRIKTFVSVFKVAAALFIFGTSAIAQIIFTDNFNSGASPLWGNQSGNWVTDAGAYNASNPFSVNYSGLPFSLTDFAVEVDIHNVADGGIWLRSDLTGQNGVLLVTGGRGWGYGDYNPQAGRGLYWHTIQGGSVSSVLNPVINLFTPEVSSIHLRVEVIGNTYSAYLDGSPTPITSITSSLFSSGRVGLYDFLVQTFDNFSLAAVPEPSTGAILIAAYLVLAAPFNRRRGASRDAKASARTGA
jgi:hypothetical protein